MTNLDLFRLAAGGICLLLALVCRRALRRSAAWMGRRLEKITPQWLKILGRGFTEPMILLIRAAMAGLAVLILPLPLERMVLLGWLVPVGRVIAIGLICWGLWRSAPVCQLLLASAEHTLEIGGGKTIGRFFENIYKAVVALLAVLSVLDFLGLPVGSLIAGAGVAGLAVSLAAQSTLSNLIAGVTLVLERPFSIGDYVTLGAVEGTVEDISFRSTRLRTPDQVLITVENATVCSEYIHNCTSRDSRLWQFELTVTYDTSAETLDALVRAVEDTLRADEQVKADGVQVIVERFDPSGITLNVRCYVLTVAFADYRALKNRLNLQIARTVREQGCRFALPASRVYMEETKDKE